LEGPAERNREILKNILREEIDVEDDRTKKRGRNQEVRLVKMSRIEIIRSSVDILEQVRILQLNLDADAARGIDLEEVAISYLNGNTSKERFLDWYVNQQRQIDKNEEDKRIATNLIEEMAKILSIHTIEEMKKTVEGWKKWVDNMEDARKKANREWSENAHTYQTRRVIGIGMGWIDLILPRA
jgi:hypothetical protein